MGINVKNQISVVSVESALVNSWEKRAGQEGARGGGVEMGGLGRKRERSPSMTWRILAARSEGESGLKNAIWSLPADVSWA